MQEQNDCNITETAVFLLWKNVSVCVKVVLGQDFYVREMWIVMLPALKVQAG